MRPCERSRLTRMLTWVCIPSSLNGIPGLFAAGMLNSETPGTLILGMGSFMLGIPGSLTFCSPRVGIPGVFEVPLAGCGVGLGFRLSASVLIFGARASRTGMWRLRY